MSALEFLFKDAHWLHISGSTIFLNENSRAACQKALDIIMSQGGKISLDPNLRSELMSVDMASEVLAPFLAAANLIMLTEFEARSLTGKIMLTRAVEALTAKYDAILALKRGPSGCSIYYNGKQLDVPGFVVEEIDPTGAGDCFSAAFIADLEAGWPLEQVSRFANAAGALAATQLGPMEGAPTCHQVENLLSTEKAKR